MNKPCFLPLLLATLVFVMGMVACNAPADAGPSLQETQMALDTSQALDDLQSAAPTHTPPPAQDTAASPTDMPLTAAPKNPDRENFGPYDEIYLPGPAPGDTPDTKDANADETQTPPAPKEKTPHEIAQSLGFNEKRNYEVVEVNGQKLLQDEYTTAYMAVWDGESKMWVSTEDNPDLRWGHLIDPSVSIVGFEGGWKDEIGPAGERYATTAVQGVWTGETWSVERVSPMDGQTYRERVVQIAVRQGGQVSVVNVGVGAEGSFDGKEGSIIFIVHCDGHSVADGVALDLKDVARFLAPGERIQLFFLLRAPSDYSRLKDLTTEGPDCPWWGLFHSADLQRQRWYAERESVEEFYAAMTSEDDGVLSRFLSAHPDFVLPAYRIGVVAIPPDDYFSVRDSLMAVKNEMAEQGSVSP